MNKFKLNCLVRRKEEKQLHIESVKYFTLSLKTTKLKSEL